MKCTTHSKPQAAPLFPCKGNLPKPSWREALEALAGPAIRLHRYRNLRSAMFYDAIHDEDCGKPS